MISLVLLYSLFKVSLSRYHLYIYIAGVTLCLFKSARMLIVLGANSSTYSVGIITCIVGWYGFPDLARDHIWRVPVPQCWNFFSRARARGQLIFIRKWVETGGKTARATLCGRGRKGTRSQPSRHRVLVYYSSK